MTVPSETPRVSPPGTSAWESEGGALTPQSSHLLPDGVTAITVTQYRVGPYIYTNIEDAMAEYRRQESR